MGSGVMEVLASNGKNIGKKAGKNIEVKKILDLREFPDLPYADRFTKNFQEILSDDSIHVVVEVMGGVNPAYEYVSESLKKGKSVVTSNKELVAAKGAELLKIANEHNVNFLFEASVGGGIPIIKPLHLCLGANEIFEIAGILNGTTNFILTKMIRESMSFADALAMAQKLGYAEANPAADVEGHDACRKICILASLSFGRHIYPESVPTEGITKITLEDVAYAESFGRVIKLIGHAKKLEDSDQVSIMVSPMMVSKSSQLSSVDDVYNGILVRGSATGDVVFYGKGAGKLPTASAVVSDIIDCIRADGTIKSLQWQDSTESRVADYKQQPVRAYVRYLGEKGAELAASLFGEVEFLSREGRPMEEAAFVTPLLSEEKLEENLNNMRRQGVEILGKIRLLEE